MTAAPTTISGLTLNSPSAADRTVSTPPGVSEATPYALSVEAPEGGEGRITITTSPPGGAPPGGAFQGPAFAVAAEGTGFPLRLTFRIDYSARLQGRPAVFLDGGEVPSCIGAAAPPAGVGACVTGLVPHEFTNKTGWKPMELVVVAARTGTWDLGWLPDDPGAGGGDGSGGSGGGSPPPIVVPPEMKLPVTGGTHTTPPAPGPAAAGTALPPAFPRLVAAARQRSRARDTVTATAQIGRANSRLVARLLYKGKVVGRLTRRGLRPGLVTFKVRLTRAGKRALRRRTTVAVVLRVAVTPPGGAQVTRSAKVVLAKARRPRR